MRLILVPLDLAALGETKLPVVEEYAEAFDADVLLLHVLQRNALDPNVVLPSEGKARAYVDLIVARMHAAGVPAEALVLSGPIAPTIVQTAIEHRADLIIIGANVRPLLRSVVAGSVAEEVVRNAPCPVLLVRPELEAGTVPLLRSFYDDVSRTGPLRQRSLGLRLVEMGRIIGSVGRAQELKPDFRAIRHRASEEGRFKRIKAAVEAGERLPPVELYKLGFGYYLLDGHHRVAAALELGQPELEAVVTEFVPMGEPQALRTFAERRAFERSTGLTSVGASHPESYVQLSALVDAYRCEHGIADYRQAAQRWYYDVYRPLWQRVRQRRLTHYFPGDRSADFIARLGTWRAEQSTGEGGLPDWDEALERFIATRPGRRGGRQQRGQGGPFEGTAPPG